MNSSNIKKKTDRELSSLEYTVLGIAHQRGPCTTYVIMKELSSSQNSYHSNRAGTAYSVTKRLVQFGLLKLQGEDQSLVSIAPEGMELLRKWVGSPIPMADIAHSIDLLRVRCFFLDVLSKDERLAMIDQCTEDLKSYLVSLRPLFPANQALNEYFGGLATINVMLETKARIRWLKLIRDLIENPIDDDPIWAEKLLQLVDGLD